MTVHELIGYTIVALNLIDVATTLYALKNNLPGLGEGNRFVKWLISKVGRTAGVLLPKVLVLPSLLLPMNDLGYVAIIALMIYVVYNNVRLILKHRT